MLRFFFGKVYIIGLENYYDQEKHSTPFNFYSYIIHKLKSHNLTNKEKQ
jgi:hypothetical protein